MDTTGMTPNMMNIVRIEAERRRTGGGSYGQQVAENDYSHLKVKMERRMEFTPNIKCEECGEMFFDANTRRRICPKCKEEKRATSKARSEANKKRCRCTVCNKVLYRVNTEGIVCKQCRERMVEDDAK